MPKTLDPFWLLPIAVAGWMNHEQQQIIDYLREENRVLRAQIGARQLRFDDDQRRRLAVRAKMLRRRVLAEVRDPSRTCRPNHHKEIKMLNEFSRRTFLKTTAMAVSGTALAEVPLQAKPPDGRDAQRESKPGPQGQKSTLGTVGIMSPGDMGSAVGQVLASHGLRVIAALGERSARTRALAAEAGIADVGTLENLVREAELIMSILVPEEAIGAAQKVAEAMRSVGTMPLYVDCNSIAVQSAQRIGETMQAVGAPFAEASIIGPPPRVPGKTRVYVSGPHAQEFAQLNQFGLTVLNLGPAEGRAKAIKICYSTVTKGTQALLTESFVSARRLGVFDALVTEFETSQKAILKFAQDGLQVMPPKAHRWVGEMNELAATYQMMGLTPRMLAGAADLYRDVSQTTLGHESPEKQRKFARSFDEFIVMLERDMPGSGKVSATS
jgi:3-hydroxyisobutyrate dehydrogenase-like beta-hydroxyacid dehydrogenase